MVAQIIISKEDSTSFFSIGSVQDDATLVSALGGALASFAVEMGLSDIGATNANYSKFQNGVLITKWIEVANYRPSLMIAIRDFNDLEQYHYMFLIDYGTILANKIIGKYEKMFSGSGEVPRFKEAVDILPLVANEIYKDSPNTLKEFISNIETFSIELLNDMWENQGDKGLHPFTFRSYSYSPTKNDQIKNEFINHFYTEGVNIDALFPLYFASTSDLKQVTKVVDDFLKTKSKISRTEISEEIKKIIIQLGEMSSSRSRKGKVEVESVDLVNADLIFERISVTDISKIGKERNNILNDLYSTLLQKLYQIYPLKFLAASFEQPLDLDFISNIFEKTTQPMLNELYTKSERISGQISSILRDVTANFSPDEAINQRENILIRVRDRFIKTIIKQDPFLVLADAELKKLHKVASQYAKEAFEQYRTAHDEAMALWYVIRQVNHSISKLKTTNLPTKIQMNFIQALIRQYQFRTIPKMVYELAKSILGNVSSASISKDPVLALLERNIGTFEREAQFSIPKDIKNTIITQFKVVKPSQQSFENIEALSFFSRAFSIALESTTADILEDFFGAEKYPRPPSLLSEAIEKIVLTSQGLHSFSKIIQAIIKQPGAQDLFTKEAEGIIVNSLKFTSILPSTIEFTRYAFETEWFVDVKEIKSKENLRAAIKNFNPNISKKDSSKIADSKLLAKEVYIPSLNLQGKIANLIKDPVINTEFWILFTERAFHKRHSLLKRYLIEIEKKQKTTAGSVEGKKRYATNIKQIKILIKSLDQMLSGGNVFQKIFMRKKDLHRILFEASKERFPGLHYYPENFVIDAEKGLIYGKKMVYSYSFIPGGFKRLSEIFASTWVRDSEYVRKLKEEILWSVLDKDAKKSLPLESKILDNLQQEASRGGRIDQETIVRNTIEQEVSIQFRKAVREAIALAFGSIREELLVRTDNRTKENYIKIGEMDINKKFLQPDYEKLNFTKIMKLSDDKVEIRMNLSELLPIISSRKKKAHTVSIYIRDGLKDAFRTRHFKAFSILGELIEQYIGEQAADLFYSRSRILEQLILESIDES
ncbi:MAG: hypothetical protein EAX90_14325 [Candidatus Heimdallarchaeota archaeon]|nr:hypothetical protein [Candidatus Heimdallarchaeota archaeon]